MCRAAGLREVSLTADDELECRPHKALITGIGRNFNRELGHKAFRTACAVSLDTPLDVAIDTLRRNVSRALSHPQSTIRLMVQGDRYWYSEATVAEVMADVLLIDRQGHGLARSIRFGDGCGDSAMPAAICVCEPYKGHVRRAADVRSNAASGTSSDEASTMTWLFRHDVVDGWRVLRFLCSLFFEECPLTFERLRLRHEDKKRRQQRGFVGHFLRGAGSVFGIALLAPAALMRLGMLGIASSSISVRRQFYMHAVVSLARLKELSHVHRTGGTSSTLTACIAAAFFAADPTRQRAVVGSNILFDPDAPQGNHVCVKMASLSRPRIGERSVLTGAARTLNAPSQGVADLVIGNVTRAFVKGQLPRGVTRAIDRRHDAMDFLVSNLPAFDSSSPTVFDLQTLREFTEWAPSIVYVIGVEDDLFCDFYWAVRPSFSTQAFMRTFASVSGAKDVHTHLADSY